MPTTVTAESKTFRVSKDEVAVGGTIIKTPPGHVMLYWQTTKQSIGFIFLEKSVAIALAESLIANTK